MKLAELAGRLLKGSGHSQAQPGDGSYSETRPSFERVSGSSFAASPELGVSGSASSEGMVNSAFGELRAPSLHAPSWAKARPLSDIRELTEPSLADTIPRRLLSDNNLPRSLSRPELSRKQSAASRRRPSTDTRYGENREPDRKNSVDSNGGRSMYRGRSSRTPSPPSPADNSSLSSIYSIPPGSVPPRSSSRTRARSESRPRRAHAAQQFSTTQRPPASIATHTIPTIPRPPSRGAGHTIPRHGQSLSPLRHVATRIDHTSYNNNRCIPSRTFIREPLSKELLEFPSHRHPRIELGLDLSASIFVGGGSIEGTVQINIDDAERIRHRRTLDIARISIDLLGIEEMSGSRRSVFLNLATELIDEDHPPPSHMVYDQKPISSNDLFWHLMPSFTNLAFSLSLPLNVGPPPFHSKNARIRYALCVSLLIRDHGKQYIVRTSDDVTVLSVYDPEKALMSLPSPLTASDEWVKIRDTSLDVVKVTAGLHRQVWVSGTSIYVDVHIMNNSRKAIKKIELQLERDILCYKHAAASTMEKSAGQARIFDNNERSILSKSSVKQGAAGWHGVPSHQTHIRTCDLEVPRGHATVKCGKYFEVRYFLNVIVGSAHTKLVTVQLPIVLIHMNSLDVVPNSVAQVAMAIEEKRTAHTYQRGHSPSQLGRKRSQSVQGRAFAAPRMQSLDRMRAQVEDLQELGETLDHSPRKYAIRRMDSNWDYHTPPSNRKGRVVEDGVAAELQDRLRRVRSNETIGSKQQTLNRGNSSKSKRAQSALGFREAEVRDDMELAGLGISGEGPFKQRLERSRSRQYQFVKKKSVERWKGVASSGVGWLKGNNGGSKDERVREDWV
ncbi:uncharacterized protein M421DRAFT_72129 [Didymella exigua CBS 183.55]|uniref:Arrestin C-terminal-like domain-containing protein n=1 Tax=Didymella exigua CBS 183.55 TaxID=1150837 RepID=A0A6A5R9V1_9PLEO|nr:uncharacterized protein M421DRAFT_72129 [Didymella exigua CBS 183.55]KAF1924522.1 hypothetical protein M421DRAFT_72129 [Didymella exigua CBS 183.55]